MACRLSKSWCCLRLYITRKSLRWSMLRHESPSVLVPRSFRNTTLLENCIALKTLTQCSLPLLIASGASTCLQSPYSLITTLRHPSYPNTRLQPRDPISTFQWPTSPSSDDYSSMNILHSLALFCYWDSKLFSEL